MMENITDFSLTYSDLSFGSVFFSLIIGLILSLILKWHFENFGSSFSNRRELGAIFPFLVLTITLVIAVVKSSLALSLGLVGALSIVRFRTPIKEPEELAYIFVAIAIGLGLGAERTLVTVGSVAVILISMTVFKKLGPSKTSAGQNLFLSISTKESSSNDDVENVSKLIAEEVRVCELRRVDTQDKNLHAVYFIEAKSSEVVFSLLKKLKQDFPKLEISLIDQHRIPGV